ncbi:MAG: hypothetical protein Tsb0018_01480 [Opitutales bacterium]|tara:strand:- start:559 stop:1341 length:783 start_codon:yes stop_codon:yes gene_type:complete
MSVNTPVMPKSALPSPSKELEEARSIFHDIWAKLEAKYGREGLQFPREILWLNGAPGAGKGTHTRFMMESCGFAVGPIVISDLLQSPGAKALKDAGLLVGDREVTGLLFEELLNPDYAGGVIVDGYPRSQVQIECLKLLSKKLAELHEAVPSMDLPRFHIFVLYVSKEESVKRQLFRGEQIAAHNATVSASGEGDLQELRKTDEDPKAAQGRYQVFQDTTYSSLQSLGQEGIFPYHLIDAHGSIESIQERILKELSGDLC